MHDSARLMGRKQISDLGSIFEIELLETPIPSGILEALQSRNF